ncbi:MAG: XdhC family protein [Dehalococcoidia bacterium]|nr:XdhC family protein [Dehalococcoidia bacterium]
MKELYVEIAKRMTEGAPFAMATVVATRGSTPRKTSAKMVVLDDGTILGTVGGGCGEAEVWQAAMESLDDGKSRIVTVDLTEATDGEDKICGGILDVFVEPVIRRGNN